MEQTDLSDHRVFLAWLATTGLTLFGFFVCWEQGLISLLYDSDRSHICMVIGLLYLGGALHCGLRALRLSGELSIVSGLSAHVSSGFSRVERSGEHLVVSGHPISSDSILGRFLSASLRQHSKGVDAEHDAGALVGTLVADAKRHLDSGWFLVDVLLKLGLLGTIVGFIFMLGSVSESATLDVNTMQKVLREMSNGMGTALYTTLAGLVGSMSLGFQYLLLDKGADSLIEQAINTTEAHLLFTNS